MTSSPTVIDLFAGCGGMTVGFVQAGFEPVCAVEFDLAAASTYAANFGENHMLWDDICRVDARSFPEADVVVGGPPCQGFSNLGTKNVDDPRNKLWEQYLRVIEEAQPKVFVVENVERFSSSSEFAMLLDEACLRNYSLSYGVLLAADYGVAQRRPRAIVIGSRIGRIGLPTPTHAQTPTSRLRPWETVRSRISDLPPFPDSTGLPSSTATFFGETVPGVFKGLDLHVGRNPTQMSLERYDHIPPGGGRFDLPVELQPACWRNKASGTTDVMGRMRWDAPSLTIRTEFFKPEKGQYLHPQWDPVHPTNRVNRPITHLEAARLQDFPDEFLWCGSKIQVAKQIGNAVPVGLAHAIARHLRPYIEG
ncbi:DNA (cytosine-5)-methyltransferase 1 [Geodermatophilus saharensis]|uniref:Cytosine-specific methyltransferase n=1 Tax=Geodermatophilus saharensis TaxID=1137994 RepID=A0A239FEI3_9ACTN|nr:DNA cytosine methyltransferase [Geodermatophilus saharensis]SNS54494.1 DNA (cytosine-5)-methyltransferase 1 [Geodermatophilus saharensis]